MCESVSFIKGNHVCIRLIDMAYFGQLDGSHMRIVKMLGKRKQPISCMYVCKYEWTYSLGSIQMARIGPSLMYSLFDCARRANVHIVWYVNMYNIHESFIAIC